MDLRVTPSREVDGSRSLPVSPTSWLPWLLGAALLGAVVVATSRFAEEREFARLLEQAEPGWLFVALALQAATYVAQAEVFGSALQGAHVHVSRLWLYQLSLAKLFVDQVLPSAGIGSTLVIARALEDRGVGRDAATACAIINIASYHVAYVVMLVAALSLTSTRGKTGTILTSVSALFIAFAIAMAAGTLALAGRSTRPTGRVAQWPGIKTVVDFLEHADRSVVRNRQVLGTATAWQMLIFGLDAATLSVCLRSLGVAAPSVAVFTSFMIASLVRTMGVVPGGLGAFEAASVVTLRLVGTSAPAALSATLIFRGLSYWLPMLPGFWSSRRILNPSSP